MECTARVRRDVIGQAGGGEGAGCGNYKPTEPKKDPSHLQFSDRGASCLASCGNIWLTFSGERLYEGVSVLAEEEANIVTVLELIRCYDFV